MASEEPVHVGLIPPDEDKENQTNDVENQTNDVENQADDKKNQVPSMKCGNCKEKTKLEATIRQVLKAISLEMEAMKSSGDSHCYSRVPDATYPPMAPRGGYVVWPVARSQTWPAQLPEPGHVPFGAHREASVEAMRLYGYGYGHPYPYEQAQGPLVGQTQYPVGGPRVQQAPLYYGVDHALGGPTEVPGWTQRADAYHPHPGGAPSTGGLLYYGAPPAALGGHREAQTWAPRVDGPYYTRPRGEAGQPPLYGAPPAGLGGQGEVPAWAPRVDSQANIPYYTPYPGGAPGGAPRGPEFPYGRPGGSNPYS